jgi:hypothetical protein
MVLDGPRGRPMLNWAVDGPDLGENDVRAGRNRPALCFGMPCFLSAQQQDEEDQWNRYTHEP